jgi:hypothetical protein
MRTTILGMIVLAAVAGTAAAAAVSTTTHGAAATDLDAMISATDLIAGQIGVEQAGDMGWHGAVGDPLDKLPAFTDGGGIRGTGLTGLMNDFPPAGSPAKLVRYDLGGAKDIAGINILTGNNGRDGRVFSTTVVRYSTNGGVDFQPLGYFQSDPSGTINAQTWGSTFVSITDGTSNTLIAGATHVQFDLYAVDNTQGQMRDPFDGVNPFTGLDDGLTAPITSPLVFELDVIEVPEPAGLILLALGGLALVRRRTL